MLQSVRVWAMASSPAVCSSDMCYSTARTMLLSSRVATAATATAVFSTLHCFVCRSTSPNRPTSSSPSTLRRWRPMSMSSFSYSSAFFKPSLSPFPTMATIMASAILCPLLLPPTHSSTLSHSTLSTALLYLVFSIVNPSSSCLSCMSTPNLLRVVYIFYSFTYSPQLETLDSQTVQVS
uniref:Uncharacterized protein n=1 Tax=Lygus hesperus TaxID=30085 RepID=A0A146LH63_LYGHE